MPATPIPAEMDVSEAIVWALAEAGVPYVLGMPGGNTGGIFSALHGHPTMRAVQVREEAIGSTMAEAYGRLTGKPLVIMGQAEWIAGNAGQGYMEALMGSSPLVILTDMSDGGSLAHHGQYQSGTADYGNWDVRKTLEGMTKRVFCSYSPAQAVQHTQLALKHALTGTPGPVAVAFHSEALRGRVGPDTRPQLWSTRRYLMGSNQALDVSALESAAQAIVESTRPVVIAGNGVRVGQACDVLGRFARELELPVATTAGGKGVFPETDPLSLGVMGTFGVPEANVEIAAADLIIAVGTRLAPIDTADENPSLLDAGRQTFVQIDVEPLNVGWTYPVDHPIVGDAAHVLPELQNAVGGEPRAAWGLGADRVAASRDRYGEPLGDGYHDDTMPLASRRIVRALQDTLPGDTIVTSDAGENRLFMLHWFKSLLPGGYLMPAAGGGMGYAVAAALGARLAYSDNPIVAVCGDGGFAMSIHALMTSVQEELPIVVVVLNNNALGWVLHGMGDKAVASRFAEFDHAEIARSVGARGVRVESVTHLEETLAEIPNLRETLVIDVPESLTTSFKDIVQPISSDRWRKAD
jgi:acetolactate synthase I/II/III large subunit